MGNYYMLDGALARCLHIVCLTPLTPVQYILGDTICAWRTVVVWNNDKCIITILVLFILGTTGI